MASQHDGPLRCTTKNASGFKNDLDDGDNIGSLLVAFYTSTKSAALFG